MNKITFSLMKTRFSGLLLFFTLCSSLLFSQEELSVVQDSIESQEGVSFGKINLPTPSSYIENYEYDPISNLYYYNLKSIS